MTCMVYHLGYRNIGNRTIVVLFIGNGQPTENIYFVISEQIRYLAENQMKILIARNIMETIVGICFKETS